MNTYKVTDYTFVLQYIVKITIQLTIYWIYQIIDIPLRTTVLDSQMAIQLTIYWMYQIMDILNYEYTKLRIYQIMNTLNPTLTDYTYVLHE